MISERCVKKYCIEDISEIENYDKAINDTTHTWECHHRDEVKILPSGIKVIRTPKELIENGRYYKCPANELIFLTKAEHNNLHKKGNKNCVGRIMSARTKIKISESHIGIKPTEDSRRKMSEAQKARLREPCSEFGKKFKEHYGLMAKDNYKLYKKEYAWYLKHNKTYRW